MVTFRICVGDYKPTKVTINIHKPNQYHPFESVECCRLGSNGVWIKSVSLPQCDLEYAYSYEKSERSLRTLYISTTTFTKEPGRRHLPPDIAVCLDSLKCPAISLKEGSLCLGLLSHLNILFNSVKDTQDLRTKLGELEHLWDSFDPLTLNNNTGQEFQLWAEGNLSVYDRKPHKLVFLSVVYGKLIEWQSMHLQDSKNLTISGKRKLLTTLEEVTQDSLTTWSLSALKNTSLQILECVDKGHWLYIAAYFPHLFQLREVLDLQGSMGALHLKEREIENTIIPKVLDGFKENEAHRIINEIPHAGRTPKERAKLQDLVDKATRSQCVSLRENLGQTLSDNGESKVPKGRAVPESAVECQTTPQAMSYSAAVKKGGTSGSKEPVGIKLPPLPDDELGEKPYTCMKANESSVTQTQEETTTRTKGTDFKSEGKVSFKLLIRDKDVSMVRLILHQGNTVTDQYVMESRTLQQNHYKNKWTLATREVILPLGADYRYQYIVTAKTAVYNVLYDTFEIKDIIRNPVSPPCQVYDNLGNPRDYNITRQNEIAAEASLLYVDMLLGTVFISSLKESIIKVEKIGFPGFGGRYFCISVIEWINQMVLPHGATESPLSVAQIQYLAVLFGKLLASTKDISNHCLEVPVVEILFSTLENATLTDFPTSVFDELKKVCMWLVADRNGTWVDFCRCFHRLFDLDSLLRTCRFLDSPRWVVKTWENDKLSLTSCLEKLSHDGKYIERLVMYAIDECSDTRVLKGILDEYYRTSKQSAGYSNVVTCAISKLDDMIKKRWMKDINTLAQIAEDLSSTNSEITNAVRRHIINFLSKQVWERGQLEVIRDIIMDPELYQTSKELTDIVRNTLKQSNHVEAAHAIFMDIIKDQNIMELAKEDTIHEVLEMGIQSLASACRTRRREYALRYIYKVLAVTKDSKHLSYESINKRLDQRAYSIVKDVSLDRFFQALSPDGEEDFGQTELTIMASHITQRLREKKQSAAESTIHMKQLQDSSGKLVIRSQPMRDLLLAMIGMQELSIPIDQLSKAGSASLSFESSIRNIMKDSEFWLMVFESKGEYSTALKHHPNSQNVADGLRLFGGFMLDRNVTIHFVKTLKRKHVLLELLEAVSPHLASDTTNQWESCLKRVEEVFELFNAQTEAFTKFFNNCVDMFSAGIDISDRVSLFNYLKELQQPDSYKTTTLRDTEMGEFWGPLFPLTNLTTELKEFMLSGIFRNICRSVLAGTSPISSHEPHQPLRGEGHDEDIKQWSEDPFEKEDEEGEEVKEEEVEEEEEYGYIVELMPDDESEDSMPDEESEDSINSERGNVLCEEKPLTGQHVLDLVLKKEPINAQGLALIIAEICVPIFHQHCQILLKGDLDIPVHILEQMTDGLSTTERLQTELQQIYMIFSQDVPQEMVKALQRLIELPGISERAKQLGEMFKTFDVAFEEDDVLHKAITRLADIQFNKALSLQQLYDALQTLVEIGTYLEPEDWEIIEQLAESQELVTFLRPNVDEDLRNLIDAVEERSEQYVSESTVSDLIDVKRYMEALLKVQSPNQAMNLLTAIKEIRPLAIKMKRLPSKINSCVSNVHSLRDLYNNVANRGERTKEIIRNALEQGVYSFVMDESSEICNAVLTYREGKNEVVYGLGQLNDYRSRALLIVNTRKHARDIRSDEETREETGLPPPAYEEFINCVNTVNDIVDICSGLRESGHFSFRCFEETVHGLENLDELKTGLKRKLDHWQTTLREARAKYYFLNFFHSKQLWQLDQFFNGYCSLTDDLVVLLRYVDTSIVIDETTCRNSYDGTMQKTDLQARLFHLGIALENIFSGKCQMNRPIPGQLKSSRSTLDSKVCKGVLFVAELDEDSTKSIPVLLRLYYNTTRNLPEASEVIFCHQGTTWEEISLLFQRCIGAPDHFQSDKLFSLVNVEQLPSETQFQLVNELQRIQNEETGFLFAMICRGGSYHHIIDQFSPKYTHCLHGFSDAEMSSCLREGWPDVEVVTSSQPGLGKTEYVKDNAYEMNRGVRTLPISGPITKDVLVNQLKLQHITSYEMLHIDAAPVSDPGLLDTFLFETVVIGMTVSGTKMCLLPTGKLTIEVANTYQDKLRNVLAMCSFFTRTHIEWNGFDSFIICQDINSPVQVVCHYLKAMNEATLDKTDVVLTGSNRITPLPPKECRSLLQKLFGSSDTDMSYSTINTFLAIFAQELRRMSASVYFTISSLKDMLGKDGNDVRSKFVQALLEVSQDFTARSVKRKHTDSAATKEALLDYRSASDVSADQMVSRMQGMVKWADSNHLLVVFHRQDSQTITTLYRLLSQVPTNISKLFKTQMNRDMPDYSIMKQEELHSILEKVCRSTRSPFEKEKLGDLQTNYALTPDNLLKMVLIHMRIKSRIPVIIMGETGCGKTTLITYLARVCEVPFEVLNLHAGVSEQDILNFVASLKLQAEKNLKQEVWGFLDEINTCDHLGLLNEIICHHTLQGAELPSNLILLAACNPYCLRTVSVESAGLEGKHQSDEMSKLVYRVHPLPETMMDFVWDYGSLDRKDEVAYIRRMLESKETVFVDLVVMSQNFMRDVEKTTYCVSLRDVHRCQHLAEWFLGMLKKKKVAHVEGDERYCNSIEIRSMILALAHCYHSRLTKAEDRQNYRKAVADKLSNSKTDWEVKENDIEQMIKQEQLDLLERMQLEDGTAKNEALRENVFVILVSILNRLPVFVVGKPGCSKSLSMQLIRSNLRGPDSKDQYFKSLPPVYVVSYQGSESSTSEGIIKVFDKAKNYKKHKEDVMPVVLLDEIGLAEVSSFNPLKVLHSQLEPTVGAFPPVAVVGISNWALDAAKMNRAIHLSRPEPTIDDLADTARSIRDDCAKKKNNSVAHHVVNDEKLKNLAKAYSEYQVKQKHSNFHGLRDYYSLVKYVAIQSSEDLYGDPAEIIQSSILRNFGGLSKYETDDIMNTFTTEIGIPQRTDKKQDTMQLIESNMRDKDARHLMLITSGDSALSILETTLEGREHVTIFGSRFANDKTEEYNYTILSEIILCMERGVTLVLRDLESIYGSLYDMLNQNYTVVGKKRNCRVALGPFSNPMCEVHQDFRCIVLVDEQKVDYQNPPFLNRFEKQTLRFSDVLTDHQIMTISCLRQWMDDICYVKGYHFSKEGMFLGMHSDTLPSLVFLRSKDFDVSNDTVTPEELAERCKIDLMRVACPDAVLRVSKSMLMKKKPGEAERFQKEYFSLPLHSGLREFFDDFFNNPMPEPDSDAQEETLLASTGCTRTILYTHSSIYTDIVKLVDGIVTVQIEKLSKFKSERHFNAQMRQFWFDADADMLVLQCMTSHDAAHMLLAKNRIDQYRNEYLGNMTKDTEQTTPRLKHACIVVHIDRDVQNPDIYPWQFNFLCGWKQYTLDTLEPTTPQLLDLLQGPVSDHLAATVDLSAIIEDQILWCFNCIKYEDKSRDVDSAMALARKIAKSTEFVGCLKAQVLNFIRSAEETSTPTEYYEGWQVDVATNSDLLYGCSTLGGALIEHIKQCVREPLGKIIVQLESANAWFGSPSEFDVQKDTMTFWQACFTNPIVFDITSIKVPTPRGPESCLVDCKFLQLKYPFFQTFHAKIESNKEWLLHQGRSREHDERDEQVKVTELCDQLTDVIKHIQELQYEYYLEDHLEDYVSDLYNTFSVEFAPNMLPAMRLDMMRWILSNVLPKRLEDEKESVTQTLACQYVTLWWHSRLIAAQLQLISIYTEVTKSSPKSLLCHIQDILDGIPEPVCEIQEGVDSENIEAREIRDTDKCEIDRDHRNEKAESHPLAKEELPSAHNEMGSQASAAVEGDIDEVNGATTNPCRVEFVTENSNSLQLDESFQTNAFLDADSEQTQSHEWGDVHNDVNIDNGNDEEHGNLETDNPIEDKGNTDLIEESGYLSINPSDEPSETVLVTKICRDVLPTKQVLSTTGGLHGWQRKASSVLLLAGRVTAESAILHYLRLCRDLVVMLSEFHLTEDTLVKLSTMGKYQEDPLADADIFQFIISFVQDMKEKEQDTARHSKLDNFLTTYFSLCLEANLDTPLLQQIVEGMCTEKGELLAGSRPVLLDIIRSDIHGEDVENPASVCEILISTGEVDEDCPNLALIDEILTEHDLDSSLASVCSDIIEDVAFCQITCARVASVTSDNDDILEIASKSVKIIEDPCEVKASLQFVTAAAFLRAFLRPIAELIEVTNTKHFKIEGKHFVLANTLNGLLKVDESARYESCNISIPLLYLLKCLRQTQSLHTLRKSCGALVDPITTLAKIEWDDKLYTSQLGYCPMSYVEHYIEAVEAISAWQIQQDKAIVDAFISKARSSPMHRLAFLAAVASTFYFIQTTEGLRDADREQAQWLLDATQGFNKCYRHFLERLLGLSDFAGILLLSEASSQDHVQIASVIVHLVSIIVSHTDNSSSTNKAFQSFLDQSTSACEMLLPATGQYTSVLDTPYSEALDYSDCVCGLRIVARNGDENLTKCPVCNRVHKRKSESDGIELLGGQQRYIPTRISTNIASTETLPGLSPISYRVIDTLIQCCFLGGLVSGFSNSEQIPSESVAPEDTSLETCDEKDESGASAMIQNESVDEASAPSVEDVQNGLLGRLDYNWRLMSEITQTNDGNVTMFLHRIIQATTDEIVCQTCPISIENKIAFETAFANYIDLEARQIPSCLMQLKSECLKADGVDLGCLESKLEELDRVFSSNSLSTHKLQRKQSRSELENDDDEEEDEDDNEDNDDEDDNEDDDDGNADDDHREEDEVSQPKIDSEHDEEDIKLQRLFRSKTKASLENFRSHFASLCGTNEKRFPFLQLCLSRLDVLQYVQYLPDLLKWNSLVIGRLNHVIKRDEAKRTKISDFLSNVRYHPSESAMTTTSIAFNTFQKAWNQVRDGWKTLTNSTPDFGIMTPANDIADCVIDKNDQMCHLRRIVNTLREIQNTFLMDAIAVVKFGQCSALNFLIKDEETIGLQISPLHAANDAIIQFEWSDNILVYHDIETEYGEGGFIKYKYAIIERELSRILVLNKAILTEGTVLTQFAYSDELFHACSSVLYDIGTTIYQDKLPNELINSIKRERDHRQTFVKDMLDHLEVILVLLKKTGGDPGSSLDEYIKRWETKLPGSFPDNLLPEPRDGIKLQHVVHLYETLEDHLVDAVVESLHDGFRVTIPKRSADSLGQRLKPMKVEELEECASNLRRFIFRYLRSDANTSTNKTINDIVVRSAGGTTINCSIITDLLPDEMEIKHVVKILEFIDKQIEQGQDAFRKDVKQSRPRAKARASAVNGGKPARRRHGGVGGVS